LPTWRAPLRSTPIPCIVGDESSWRSGQRVSREGGKCVGRRGGLRSWSARWDSNSGDRFFKGVLAAHRGAAETAGIEWEAAVYQEIERQHQEAELSVQGMCRLAEVSRAGFYRVPWASCGTKTDMDVRDAMQRIALEFSSYGWPRMTAELRRRGWVVSTSTRELRSSVIPRRR